jgi:predicted ATPase
MKLRKIRIQNYKSFLDSGWVSLPNRFTFVVGQNSVGKTAFLESLRIFGVPHKPHKNLENPEGFSAMGNPIFDTDIDFSGDEIRNEFRIRQPQIRFPTQLPAQQEPTDALHLLNRFTTEETIHFSGRGSGGNNSITFRSWPSHGLFPDDGNRFTGIFNISPEFEFTLVGSSNADDTVPDFLRELYQRKFYLFGAQRFEVGKCPIEDTSILSSDARNLPAVLSKLNKNRILFNRFEALVKEVFPSLRSISISQTGGELEIFVYNVNTDRSDLALSLQDSGTGLSQAMAIIYVTITTKDGIIVIDEPASFLHPSAAKSLMQILTNFKTNQYVVSTHNSEIISSLSPESVLLITIDEGISNVRELDIGSIDGAKFLLDEVGASLSDVFGLDAVIWVEGQTEQEAFPILLRELTGANPVGVSFRAMRHTSDFERKRREPVEAWDLYSRLSSGGALVPPAIAFAFDRDERSEQVIADMIRQSGGRAKFLPREMYENYLLDADALSAILSNELGSEVSPDQCRISLEKHVPRFMPKDRHSNPEIYCHAANVLKAVFSDIGGAGHPFKKLIHSLELTRWLSRNKPQTLIELKEYIESLLSEKYRRQVAD